MGSSKTRPRHPSKPPPFNLSSLPRLNAPRTSPLSTPLHRERPADLRRTCGRAAVGAVAHGAPAPVGWLSASHLLVHDVAMSHALRGGVGVVGHGQPTDGAMGASEAKGRVAVARERRARGFARWFYGCRLESMLWGPGVESAGRGPGGDSRVCSKSGGRQRFSKPTCPTSPAHRTLARSHCLPGYLQVPEVRWPEDDGVLPRLDFEVSAV